MRPAFRNRSEAGKVLAVYLSHYRNDSRVLVFGLARGGVPVALEVARTLQAPLDVFVVRKIGFPAAPELALGAIASGDVHVWNDTILGDFHGGKETLDRLVARESIELRSRETLYRKNRSARPIEGRVVILIDDGLATGASMRAAIRAIRKRRPSQVIVAVPVGSPDTCRALTAEVDALICPFQPEEFRSVGEWYTDFSPTIDQEVQACLESGLSDMAPAGTRSGESAAPYDRRS